MSGAEVATASQQEAEALEQLYRGRVPYHGEMHDHSNSGGTSDGECTLTEWKEGLEKLHMDFAAILDHRQVRHMHLPEFDEHIFVCGTEPGTYITDSRATQKEMHYNMLFPTPEGLPQVLEEFPEFCFEGGIEGHFTYPSFTKSHFVELIDSVLAKGGFFVVPHPKQITVSDYDEDYWYRDGIGIEVFYRGAAHENTAENYALWTRLLKLGKRVYACSGGDGHSHVSDKALTTVYAEPKDTMSKTLLPVLRTGDFTCGSVGIRMAAGNTLAGGDCDFTGHRLTVSAGDFHRSVVREGHNYELIVLKDEMPVGKIAVLPESRVYVSLAMAPDAHYYRAEVADVTAGYRIAVGNPIWNDRI